MNAEEFESAAESEFERLFRLEGRERAAARTPGSPPWLVRRVDELLDAYDRNRADRFLDAPPTGLADLSRWSRLVENWLPQAEQPVALGAFEITRILAAGDLCSIYLGRQTSPIHRFAAIKLLHSTARRRETLRRFDTERQAIAGMRHPNIAQFFEAGVADSGQAYFAMEYIDGPPITQFCGRESLPVPDRLHLFLQVCSATAHAHQRGILHRDLKPSNILVATEGDTPQAKVIDFGVSKAIDASAEHAATMTGQVVGTLDYMSPEQLRGDHDQVDTRSDVFALGLVLFEMLAGRPAYAAADDSRRSPLRRAEDTPARLAMLSPQFGGDLDTIVAKATAMDPALRYPAVTDFAADVQRYLDGRPVLARNPGAVHTAWKFVRRNKLATATAAIVLSAGALAGAEVNHARNERSELVMRVAQAWLETALETQRTIGESPRREPGMTRLVQAARQLASDLPGDERAFAMLATSLAEFGYVKLEKRDFATARSVFEESLEIRRRLAASGFGPLGGMGELSLAIVRCGDVASAEGDKAERDRRYRTALAIDEQAVQLYPDEPMALSNLGWSYERLASPLPKDDPLRMSLLQRQIEVFSALNDRGPTKDSLRGLTNGYGNLSVTKHYVGLPCVEDAQKAVTFGNAGVALAPDDRYLALAALKAEFLLLESSPETACDQNAYFRFAQRVERFVDEDPHDTFARLLLESAAFEIDQFLAAGAYDAGELATVITWRLHIGPKYLERG
ncbi:MAG: serine/threonine-protein kinase [Phycisphaerales bacterium]